MKITLEEAQALEALATGAANCLQAAARAAEAQDAMDREAEKDAPAGFAEVYKSYASAGFQGPITLASTLTGLASQLAENIRDGNATGCGSGGC